MGGFFVPVGWCESLVSSTGGCPGKCPCGGFSPLPFGGLSNGVGSGLCYGNSLSSLRGSSSGVGGLGFEGDFGPSRLGFGAFVI